MSTDSGSMPGQDYYDLVTGYFQAGNTRVFKSGDKVDDEQIKLINTRRRSSTSNNDGVDYTILTHPQIMILNYGQK